MNTVSPQLIDSVDLFVKRVLEINPRLNGELVADAYNYALKAHKDQVRKSGDPYLVHPVAVALILAEQQLDSVTIAAGLLHDVIEDTPSSREDILAHFGEEVSLLVDGVTKIKTFQMKSRSREERQAETFRKMLLSMSKDLRVIIIKFADRLHNLRTLGFLAPDRVKDIARETLDIYAPLAHRLGMARIKWEVEDLAFKYLYPDEYKQIVSRVVDTRRDREQLIESFSEPLRVAIHNENVSATVIGRPKHFYSIYRKMVHRNKPFEEIFDLLAIRVITESIADCYQILGIIHSKWKPIADRFKDYISTPKSNGYQSLHTTVVGPAGNIVEMQIRTWEMNQVAEDGIASHWLYKTDQDASTLTSDDKALVWLKNLIEWQKDLTDSNEFLEFFKIDLFHAEIFVFTPRGDLISLPKGATVLDFAFAVHTDLGLHCIGARVDGKIESISGTLKSGSTVEILHLSSKKPSLDWLREVKTPKARSAIRRWLKSTGRQESIDLGKKIIHTRLRKQHLTTSFSDHVPALLQHLGVNSLDRLYELVGNGELPITRIVQYFDVKKSPRSVSSRVVSSLMDTFTGRKPDVLVGGEDNLMVRFARCCNPVPGDAIIGFVTRGRGISVHRSDCKNAALFSSDNERTIRVNWDEGPSKKYAVFLDVLAGDRPGLLHDITSVLADLGANIVHGTIRTEHHHVHNTFHVEIRNRNQLKQILRRMQKIKGIEKVTRTRDRTHVADDE